MVHKLRFCSLTMVTLSVISFLTSCGDEKATETTAPKTYLLGNVQRIDPATFEGESIANLLVNAENQRAYVLNNEGELFRVSLENGVKDFSEKKNWTKLQILDEAKNDSPGMAKLDQNEPNPRERRIFSTKKGFLVLTNLRDGATRIGALAYFEGDANVPTHAWTNQAVHISGQALDENNNWQMAGVVNQGDSERFVVIDSARDCSSVERGANQFVGQHVLGGTPLNTRIVSNDTTVFFVDERGVAFFASSELGSNKNPDAIAADASSAYWRMVPGVDNYLIREVYLHAGKIFIALTVSNYQADIGNEIANRGGIAIYDIASQKTQAPHNSLWGGVNASRFIVHNLKLRAVANGSWVEIKDDGSWGEASFSLATIANNKYEAGKEVADRTYYHGEISRMMELKPSIYAVYPVGDDMILEIQRRYVNSLHSFSISFEKKNIKKQPRSEV